MPIRHIVRGLIDGSLASLGVVLGAAVSGDPKIIMAAGLGGSMANALSNVVGALTAERADVMKKLSKYEKAMVGSEVDLKRTKIYEKEKQKILRAGLLDGVSTFAGAVVPIIPFAVLNLQSAALASTFVTISLLFCLGTYVGKLSKENLIIAGSKMALFGVLAAILASSLEHLF